MSAMQRNKGKRGERMHAKVLRTLGVTDARRGVQHAGGPDSPDVIGIPGTHAEVKYENKRFWVCHLDTPNAAVLLKVKTDLGDFIAFRAKVALAAAWCIREFPLVDEDSSGVYSYVNQSFPGLPVCHLAIRNRSHKRGIVKAYWEQAVNDSGEGEIPYLVLRENGMGEMDEVWIVRARDAAAFAGLLVEHTRKEAADG
jgi:hypothetical protein